MIKQIPKLKEYTQNNNKKNTHLNKFIQSSDPVNVINPVKLKINELKSSKLKKRKRKQ